MCTLHQYHKGIRWIAIVLAVVNLAACFTLDGREWLVSFDPWIVVGVVVPAFVVVLPSLPYLVPLAQRLTTLPTMLLLVVVTAVFCLFETLWFVMIGIATFCRGPNWNFYWPWEERVPRVVATNNANLSEWVWYLLDQQAPGDPLTREWPGIALLATHLVIMPLIVCWLWNRTTAKTSLWRLLAFFMTIQFLTALPAKIALRWLFNIKYVISFPEQVINF